MIIEFWKTGENPITCYDSTKAVEKMPDRVPTKKNSNNKKPVTVVSKSGVKEEFESVIKAADAVGISSNALYSFLNGRAENKTEFTIYKSNLNK